MLDQVCKVDVTMPSKILLLLSESPHLWAAFHYHAEARFLLDSCGTDLLEMLVDFCQHLDRGFRIFFPLGIISTRITSSDDSDHDLAR